MTHRDRMLRAALTVVTIGALAGQALRWMAEHRLSQARAAAKAGQIAAASRAAASVIRWAPFEPTTLLPVARGAAAGHWLAGAEGASAVARTLWAMPLSGRAWEVAGRYSLQRSAPGAAIYVSGRATQVSPTDPRCLRVRALAGFDNEPYPEFRARAIQAAALAIPPQPEGLPFTGNDRDAAAIEVFRMHGRIYPKSRVEMEVMVARRLQKLGRVDEALAVLEAVRPSAGSETWRVDLHAGGILGDAHRWQDARAAVTRSLRISGLKPDQELALRRVELGGLTANPGAVVDDVESCARRLMVLQPADGNPAAAVAEFHLRSGRAEAAAEWAQLAVSVDSGDTALWAWYAELAQRLGSKAETIRGFEAAWRLSPSTFELGHKLIAASLAAGDVARAIAAMNRLQDDGDTTAEFMLIRDQVREQIRLTSQAD